MYKKLALLSLMFLSIPKLTSAAINHELQALGNDIYFINLSQIRSSTEKNNLVKNKIVKLAETEQIICITPLYTLDYPTGYIIVCAHKGKPQSI